MATREDRRAEAVPGVARLVRSRDFRTSLARVTGESNAQTIVVALPDDRVGYIFDRVREAGGVAAVAMVDGQVCKIAIMFPASAARVAVAEEDDSLSQIHPDSRIDMFFDYLEIATIVVVRCVAARLIDRGELQLA